MNIQKSVSRSRANKRGTGYFEPKIRLRSWLISCASRGEEACRVKC
jgi:hypothetical protein